MVQWEIWDSEAWERKQKLHNLNWRRDVHRETHNAPFLMPGGKANHVFISFKNPPGLPSRVLNSWTEGADPAAGLRTPLPAQVAPHVPRQRVDGGWMCASVPAHCSTEPRSEPGLPAALRIISAGASCGHGRRLYKRWEVEMGVTQGPSSSACK